MPSVEEELARRLARGEEVVLATVVKLDGEAPSQPGAKLLMSSAASRDIRSLAPGWEGASPSSLTTVASTTSSPRASRRASSSSTLGMHAAATQHGVEDLARPHHLSRRGGVTGRQAQAAERLLEAH